MNNMKVSTALNVMREQTDMLLSHIKEPSQVQATRVEIKGKPLWLYFDRARQFVFASMAPFVSPV
jgi:hypothetical protein